MLEVGMLTAKWERYVRPAADAVPDLPDVRVGEAEIHALRFGHRIPADPGSDGLGRALDPEGTLIAIVEAVEGGSEWHPRKVFLA
jgi:hypothetical protein